MYIIEYFFKKLIKDILLLIIDKFYKIFNKIFLFFVRDVYIYLNEFGFYIGMKFISSIIN